MLYILYYYSIEYGKEVNIFSSEVNLFILIAGRPGTEIRMFEQEEWASNKTADDLSRKLFSVRTILCALNYIRCPMDGLFYIQLDWEKCKVSLSHIPSHESIFL